MSARKANPIDVEAFRVRVVQPDAAGVERVTTSRAYADLSTARGQRTAVFRQYGYAVRHAERLGLDVPTEPHVTIERSVLAWEVVE